MNDYFIVYKKEQSLETKIGLFIGKEEDLKKSICKWQEKDKQLIQNELEMYHDYKVYIKQFISDQFKLKIKNNELTKLVLQETYKWVDRFDKLSCNFHINPNSGKIVMETIHYNSSYVVPSFRYEKIEVLDV
jgi:hypothetical protein